MINFNTLDLQYRKLYDKFCYYRALKAKESKDSPKFIEYQIEMNRINDEIQELDDKVKAELDTWIKTAYSDASAYIFSSLTRNTYTKCLGTLIVSRID